MITIEEIKRLAQEAQSPPDEPRLLEFCRYGQSDTPYDHYYSFLYRLARRLQPDCIVELGVELGRSLFAMGAGSPHSEVIGIELSGQVPSTWGQYIASLRNVTIVSGTDTVVWGLSHRHIQIGLLYIDSDHSYETVMEEWHCYRPLMEPGGVVCFDDASHSGPQQLLGEIGLPKIIFDGNDAPLLHNTNLFACVLVPE